MIQSVHYVIELVAAVEGLDNLPEIDKKMDIGLEILSGIHLKIYPEIPLENLLWNHSKIALRMSSAGPCTEKATRKGFSVFSAKDAGAPSI